MTNIAKFQSNALAAICALALSAVFVGLSVGPAATSTLVALSA
jgi:hypothetical protein